MTLTVVDAKADRTLTPEAFEALAAGWDRIVVDVGTGDARGAYARARRSPDTLVIGTDAAVDNARATVKRAARKPARGGLTNLLVLRAAAEDPPPELAGRADEVQAILPWGSLLVDLVEAGRSSVDGLAALGRAGAAYTFVLNGEIWLANTPDHLRSLPEATPDAVLGLADRYAAAGLRLESARYLDADERAALESTWARRLLASRTDARFLEVRATRIDITGTA